MKRNGIIKIEKGIPAPQFGGRGARKYPWHEMKVGDSFVFPTSASFAYEAARTATKRYAPKVFRAGKNGDEMRCWRTA